MNSRFCTHRSWFVMIGRNSRSMHSVEISVICSAALEWTSFRTWAVDCCCNLDSCSNLSFESEQLLLKLWGGGNRPGWRRSRLRSRTGCWLSWSQRRSSGKGRRRGTAGSRRWWRENTQGTLHMDGMRMKRQDKCERLEPRGVMNELDDATTDCVQVCSILHVVHVYVRRVIYVIVHNGPHRCWRCACRCTHFSVTICHSHLFVNFCIRRYSIYTTRRWQWTNCVGCYRYNHDKFCIQFLLRFIPQMNSWRSEYTSFPVQSVVTPSLWWILIIGFPPVRLPLPPWGGTLWPIFIVLLVPPLSSGGTMSTMLSWSQVDVLSASYRNSPHSSESTSCHGRHQFLLVWQYDCGLRLQADPSQGWSLQSDPTQSSFFWRTCSGWIGRGCCHISSCDNSFEVDLPCGTLCNQVLSRTCDRVAGPSLCRSSGWRTNPARMRCTSCFL